MSENKENVSPKRSERVTTQSSDAHEKDKGDESHNIVCSDLPQTMRRVTIPYSDEAIEKFAKDVGWSTQNIRRALNVSVRMKNAMPNVKSTTTGMNFVFNTVLSFSILWCFLL